MNELLGKLEAEAPISSGDEEGKISLHEKGLVYDGPGVNGKIYSLYSYVEKVEALEDLQLGKVRVRMVFFSTLGERFDLKFVINEHFLHELKERKGRV